MNTLSIVSRANFRDFLSQLYLEDPRPWLVGFSGGKDSTMLAALIFDALLSIPPSVCSDLWKPAMKSVEGGECDCLRGPQK